MFRFTQKQTAESFRNRAFETTGTSLMLVKTENFYLACTRREAAKYYKQGLEVF